MAHVVNVSGGMASAVSLFRVIERFGVCEARFADVRQEHEDCYRFLDDLEAATGVKITRLDQGKNCWDVWFERMMWTSPSNGGCVASYHLKKVPLRRHAEENYDPENTTIYVGFGADEDDRREGLEAVGAPWRFDYPLMWKPWLGRCDLADFLRERGVEPPSTYELGYPHANCRTRCILAGIAQWAGVLKDDPEGYREDEDNEQEFLRRLREAGRKEITILRDRRGGITNNLSLRQLREEIESGERCHNDDWRAASCSCMGNLFA